MNLRKAKALAWAVFTEELDAGWSWAFVQMADRGHCYWKERQITLSIRRSKQDPLEEFVDTVLHEIAHVRTPNKAPAHGKVWRRHYVALCKKWGLVPQD